MQVSHCVDTEVSQEEDVRKHSPVFGLNISISGPAEGLQHSGGHVCVDHVHMLIEIPPKHSVSHVVGFIKGKSAIAISRNFSGKRQNFTGQHFWARGYLVSTVGRDEETIRQSIQTQGKEDQRLEQLSLFNGVPD